ncbi:sugar ABC transporter substrate-binding protein [Phytohabitans sp. ZYX-F-186]|uniref:Sugar ABC transporter substrate-binding protein n=1 Tax=Phytohabitans maris TaxID=3071409 RepID=A0ABU0ZPS5_9ACTN|nr:sugar ABC transporter substrate-binding protein [Phytohabitans sp. ZYX-F-186]MDQ7909028.1 sugar ABC transporter substrate-binding protein [Phytohabitans sp. ZYX-F-186]
MSLRQAVARSGAAMAALLVAAAGCGGERTSAPDPSGPLAGRTVGYLPPNLRNQVYIELMNRFTRAVEAAGGRVVVGDAAGDPTKQLQQAQGWITRRQVDAWLVLPVAPRAFKPVLDQAARAGIASVVGSTPAEMGYASAPAGIGFSGSDWAELGRLAGQQLSQCINERLGGRAQVAILGGPPLPGPVVTERIAAQKAAILAGSPGARIVAEADGQSQRKVSQDKMAAILQAHKDVNALTGTSDDSILGGVQALRQAGRDPAAMCVVGIDGTPDGRKALTDGTFYADVVLDHEFFGSDTVQVLTGLLADPTRPGPQRTIPFRVLKP